MTESAPIPEDLRLEYESWAQDGPRFKHRITYLIERIAQLEVTVSELRAINERLVLDVKRCTEENENLRATQYRD